MKRGSGVGDGDEALDGGGNVALEIGSFGEVTLVPGSELAMGGPGLANANANVIPRISWTQKLNFRIFSNYVFRKNFLTKLCIVNGTSD